MNGGLLRAAGARLRWIALVVAAGLALASILFGAGLLGALALSRVGSTSPFDFGFDACERNSTRERSTG